MDIERRDDDEQKKEERNSSKGVKKGRDKEKDMRGRRTCAAVTYAQEIEEKRKMGNVHLLIYIYIYIHIYTRPSPSPPSSPPYEIEQLQTITKPQKKSPPTI